VKAGVEHEELLALDVFQPVFTDVLEFQKFNRENKFRPVVIESQKLPQVLAKEAKGVVLNPIGINMPMLLNKRVQGQPQADVQAQPQPQPEAAPENQEM
jgi:hypothetical protein